MTGQVTVLRADHDSVWLNQLTNEPLSATWFDLANTALREDVGTSADGRIAAAWPRVNFYENLMSFGYTDSPVHDTYVRFAEKRKALVPLAAFVTSNRTFNAKAIDTLAIADKCPALWSQQAAASQQRIEALETVMGEEPASQLVELHPKVLQWKDYADRFTWLLAATEKFGCSDQEARRVPFVRPNALGSTRSRLELSANYLQLSSQPTFTASEIGALLIEHPDRHLIAVTSGIAPYTYKNIKKVIAERTVAECRSAAAAILDDPQAAQRFGQQTIDSHRQLHAMAIA